jgi:hypothetical protein
MQALITAGFDPTRVPSLTKARDRPARLAGDERRLSLPASHAVAHTSHVTFNIAALKGSFLHLEPREC